MNILHFIDSESIRRHLQKINYSFTADEAAFIVWQNSHRNSEEKHAMWTWIINSMDDVNLYEKHNAIYNSNCPINPPKYHSLFDCLKTIIKTRNKLIAYGTKSEPNTVFSFYVYDKCGFIRSELDSGLFSSYEECMQGITKVLLNANVYQNCNHILLKKQWINKTSPKSITLKLSRTGKLLDIDEIRGILSPFEKSFFHMFYDMYFHIPTPFKKGDILCINRLNQESFFVLESFLNAGEENTEDSNEDMCDRDCKGLIAYGYFFHSDGLVSPDYVHNYLNLEYCNKKSSIKKAAALSKYLKGEINISSLLNAHIISTYKLLSTLQLDDLRLMAEF